MFEEEDFFPELEFSEDEYGGYVSGEQPDFYEEMDPSDYGRVHTADILGTAGGKFSRDPLVNFYEQVNGKIYSYISQENIQKGVSHLIRDIPPEKVILLNIDVLVVVSTYIVEEKMKNKIDLQVYLRNNPDINPLDFVRYLRMLT